MKTKEEVAVSGVVSMVVVILVVVERKLQFA